ncbi:MAG: SUF system Fe-S cluster assembly protein [Sphingomonadales bacterium]|nr:SUF system Fe-S cluster assembly protein [Sphingomonadales bacterium]
MSDELAMDDHTKTDSGPERPIVTEAERRGFLDRFLNGQEAADEEPVQNVDNAPVALEERIVDALRQIYDPEIPVNIYDLGLIYGVEVDAGANAMVTMTLTTPHCPVAESMPGEVEMKVRDVPGIGDVTVDLVWDPPWDIEKMSDEAKLELGFL